MVCTNREIVTGVNASPTCTYAITNKGIETCKERESQIVFLDGRVSSKSKEGWYQFYF